MGMVLSRLVLEGPYMLISTVKELRPQVLSICHLPAAQLSVLRLSSPLQDPATKGLIPSAPESFHDPAPALGGTELCLAHAHVLPVVKVFAYHACVNGHYINKNSQNEESIEMSDQYKYSKEKTKRL